MPGKKGSGGPVPKRSSQRRRRNRTKKPDRPKAPAGKVKAPKAHKNWHPTARAWYDSLAKSGQSEFYEPSDWQAAYVLAGELSAYLKNPRRSAMMFAQIWSGMSELLTTEGARRRVKIEVDREPAGATQDEKSEVASLDAYRQRAAAG